MWTPSTYKDGRSVSGRSKSNSKSTVYKSPKPIAARPPWNDLQQDHLMYRYTPDELEMRHKLRKPNQGNGEPIIGDRKFYAALSENLGNHIPTSAPSAPRKQSGEMVYTSQDTVKIEIPPNPAKEHASAIAKELKRSSSGSYPGTGNVANAYKDHADMRGIAVYYANKKKNDIDAIGKAPNLFNKAIINAEKMNEDEGNIASADNLIASESEKKKIEKKYNKDRDINLEAYANENSNSKDNLGSVSAKNNEEIKGRESNIGVNTVDCGTNNKQDSDCQDYDINDTKSMTIIHTPQKVEKQPLLVTSKLYNSNVEIDPDTLQAMLRQIAALNSTVSALEEKVSYLTDTITSLKISNSELKDTVSELQHQLEGQKQIGSSYEYAAMDEVLERIRFH